MPTLTVRSPRDPFALIEIRNSRYEAVAIGTAELVTEVMAGRYSVIATAAGREDERELDVTGDLVVEVDLGDHPSAAPTAGSSTIVAAHARATVELSGRLVASAAGRAAVGVVLRRPAGSAPGPMPRWSDGSPAVAVSGVNGTVALSWTGGDEHAEAGAVVEPGPLVATIGGNPATAIVVPAWRGWQTLVFLPITDEGIAASMAVMHVVPLDAPWRPELPIAELFDHLHWALVERPPVTEEAIGALRRRLSGMPWSPLLHLMIAHVASTGEGPAAQALVADSLSVLDAPGVRELVASDVGALRSTSAPSVAVPILAHSADLLMDRESRQPGSIVGPAAEAIASRWASPLWFEWSPANVVQSGPHTFTDEAWRNALAGAASALAVPGVLDRVAAAHSHDPATARLVASLRDESLRQRVSPSDVLMAAHPGDVMRRAGLPAVGALRAMQQLVAFAPSPPERPREPREPVRPPRRWPRRLLWIAGAAVVLGGLGTWAAIALDDDDPPPDTTVAPTVEITSPPTDATIAPTDVPTVSTDAPVTDPPASTDDPTTTLEPNSRPIVDSVSFLALADTPLVGEIPVIDPDGDELTVRIVEFGRAEIDVRPDGSFTYFTPDESGFEDSFTVVFSDGAAESEPATVFIEVLPNVTVDTLNSPVPENRGPLRVVISLTGPALSPVVVQVEATVIEPDPDAPPVSIADAEPGVDFEEPDPFVTIDPDVGEIILEIEIIDDKDVEGDEHFVVRVSVVYDGEPVPFEVPVTIRDDDVSIL